MSASPVSVWSESQRRHAGRVALVQAGRRWTYAELGAEIRALSGLLVARLQVGPGEPVGVLAPNGMAFGAAYFGILAAGGAVQPIDPRLTPRQRRSRLQESGARILLVHESLAASAAMTGPTVEPRHVVVIGDEGMPRDGGDSPSREQAAPSPERVAEMMHTSGTTGEPKIALRSHANVHAAARNSIRGFGYRAGDVIAIAMPLSHSSALNSQLVPILQLGGTVVLFDRFDPDAFLAALREHRVTCMRLVPSMLTMLLAREDFDGEHLPDMRLLVNSSAPVNAASLTALSRRFPRVEVMDSYGLTEASTCTVLVVDPEHECPGAVGRPIDGVTLDVVDAAGESVPPGGEGEVRVRGDHVFLGYLDRPQETAEVLRDGWLWTGDMGHLDEQGGLHLHGRKADVINVSGFKVHPFVVERCIRDLPEVESVAVVGMPHRVLGEVVKAYVVSRVPGVAASHVIHHCARRLASHEVPFRVEFVDALPTGETGKVRRAELKESQR